MRRWLAPLFVLIVLFNSTEAAAMACNPGQSAFDDVPDSAIFCREASWLRNALVTLGCAGGNYCPGENVTRGQMALFMNRLATALTPDVVMLLDTSSPEGDLDTGGVATCVSNPYVIPAGANGRYLASIIASVSILTDGPADLQAEAEGSVDGGPFLTITGGSQLVHVPANQWTNVTHLAAPGLLGGLGGQLPPGHAYQFRLRLTRAGAGTGNVSNARCKLRADLPVNPVAP